MYYFTDEYFRKTIDCLVGHFPVQMDVERVLISMEVNRGDVVLNGDGWSMWNSAISYINKIHKQGRLIDTALEILPGNSELIKIKEAIEDKTAFKEVPQDHKVERKNNLYPRKYGKLIGRNKEIERIIEGFNNNFLQVVVEGFPGVGKTSVALETGYLYFGKSSTNMQLDKYLDYVVWVSAKDKPEQKLWFNDVLNKIANVLGYPNITQTAFNNEKKEKVRNLLTGKEILLIIDNFETIDDPELKDWLHDIPEPNKVLITSRKEIDGDYWKVRMQGFSDEEALTFLRRTAEVEQLGFIESASDDELLSLVKVTAGNPQALRLALGYISKDSLSLQEVVQKLKTENTSESESISIVHSRLLNASWNSIGENAQRLLLVTTFFMGAGFIDQDALKATSGLDTAEFNKAFQTLVEWNLLERGPKDNRFITQSITREFAKKQLNNNKEYEFEARKRWCEYYLRFVKETIIRDKPDIPYWNVLVSGEMEKVDLKWDSIYEVIKWTSREHKRPGNKKLLLELILLLIHYMDSRFLNIERLRFVSQAIEFADSLGYIYQEAILRLDALGWTYVEENRLEDAMKEIDKGMVLAKEINRQTGGAKELIALGNAWLARVKIEQRKVAEAFQFIQLALEFNDNSKPWIQFRILMAAGDIYFKQAHHEKALQYYVQAKTKMDDYGGEGHFYQINPRIGLAFLGLGQAYNREAEQIFEEVRNNPKIAIGKLYGDYGYALIQFREGNIEEANYLIQCTEDELKRKTNSNILLKLVREFEKTFKKSDFLENMLPPRDKFQTTMDGKETDLYVLKNNKNMYAVITNYGGRLVSLLVPDEKGKLTDVIVGPDSIGLFKLSTEPYFGATIGRYGNRIANGRFSIDDKEYILPKNEGGITTLHGGKKGFQYVVWDANQIDDCCLELSYLSKDGEEGFPGNLNIKVTFTLTDENELRIDYVAITDKTTIVNFTNHAFFNLEGQQGTSILDHKLHINADYYTPVNANLIPLGTIEAVAGTPLDFREPVAIGKRICDDHVQLSHAKGYDHNFVLNQKDNEDLTLAARVVSDISKIQMEIFTKEPCLLFYSGNFMESKNLLKDGNKDDFRTAFVLETHRYPDSPNQVNFPDSILEPGKLFKTSSVYKFTIT